LSYRDVYWGNKVDLRYRFANGFRLFLLAPCLAEDRVDLNLSFNLLDKDPKHEGVRGFTAQELSAQDA